MIVVLDGSASYLSTKCQVVGQPKKGGYGVLAVQPIFKGEIICIWGGRIVDAETLFSMPHKWRQRSMQVAENHYHVSLTTDDPPSFIKGTIYVSDPALGVDSTAR